AAPAGAGDRTDRDFAAAHTNQNFRARADDLERSEIEVTEEGGGIDSAECPVERKSGQREFCRKALRENNLKNIAGPNIFLPLFDHLEKTLLRRVRERRAGECATGREGAKRRRAFESSDDGFKPFDRALMRSAKRSLGLWAQWRDHEYFVTHGIENDHHG